VKTGNGAQRAQKRKRKNNINHGGKDDADKKRVKISGKGLDLLLGKGISIL
jgi:hypothetical protein